jgi:hypothetical protein
MQQEVKSYNPDGRRRPDHGCSMERTRHSRPAARGILICFHLGKAAMHTQMDAKDQEEADARAKFARYIPFCHLGTSVTSRPPLFSEDYSITAISCLAHTHILF